MMTEGPDPAWRRLCALADIPDGGSNGFSVVSDDDASADPVGLLAVRKGGALWVYVNRCPHVRMPLDFTPGRFLDRSATKILCANHGALFRIEDGTCLAGPCRGHHLIAVANRIDSDNNVWIPAMIAL
ncbi:MAG: Rieske 2Fe-2S domain-containing protein [Proteobacteria bacterium]|nr:Rieske 2Fe-2S domain-containing protein [Pseudomonadota bacterium]